MQVRFSHHPSADDLEEYALGRAGEAQAEPIEEHLLLCEVCRELLDEIEQQIRVLRIVLREVEVTTPVQ